MTPRTEADDRIPLGIVYTLVEVFAFAVMSVAVKMTAGEYHVMQIMFFRTFFAGLVIVPMLLQAGGAQALKTTRPWLHIRRSVIGTTVMILNFLSLGLIPLADATAIGFTTPLFVTALSVPFLGEKVGLHRWGAVVVGFIGVLIVVQPGVAPVSLGTLAALGAASLGAIVFLTLRQMSRTEASITIVAWFTIVSTLVSTATLPFVWKTPSLGDAALLIGTGILGGIGQITMTNAYRYAPAAVVGALSYTSILWASLFGLLFFDQAPGLPVILGASLVIAAGIYILYRETRRNVSVVKPGPMASEK
jgi:drug/metabolite transporter (DMT)-like permease